MSGSPIPDFRYNINESSYISASTVIDQHRNLRTNISNEATNIGYGAALSATLQSLHHSALPATVPSVVGFNNGSVATAVAADAANSQSSASTASTGSIQQRDDVDTFYFYETEQFTVLWILFAMIVLGNSAVLGTLIFNKSRKSRMNFFVKQLAIADLAVGLINVLTDIITRITITWHAGNAACKLIRFVEAVVTFSSTYVLVALTIDRYDAITHPMKFSGSWRRARVLVITAWLLSVLFSLPLIFLFEEKPIQGQMQCWIDLQPWQWKVYMTLIALVLFVIPAVIITACYTIIVRTIWSKSLTLAAAVNAKTDISSFVLGDDHRALRHHINNSEEDCRRASSRGVIPKAKVKTVKMTFVIVFVFVICWSPYIVFDLLQVYGYIPPTQTNIAIATFIQSLAPLNSAANPVIYCLFSTQMCRTLRNFPPFKWVASCLTMCFPGLETGGGYCLGYGNGDSTRTVTTSITHSSRRSGSATSVRNVIRLQTMNSRHRTAVMAATATAAGVVPVAVAGNSVKKVAISVV